MRCGGRPPPGSLTAPGTRSRSNQSKPQNWLNRSPISVAYLLTLAKSLILSKREHLVTFFHSQPALTSPSVEAANLIAPLRPAGSLHPFRLGIPALAALSARLQDGLRFLRHPLPPPPSPFLAVGFPL